MKLLRCVVLIFVLVLSQITKAQNNMVKFYPSHLEQKQSASFSDAVEANGFLFLAGQIGYDYEKGELVKGGIQAETEKAILNIKEVLEYHGVGIENVIKCTVILKNIDDFAAFNEIYSMYFKQKPARTTFAASGLARGSLIEIEAVAVKNGMAKE